jgi:WD40 repeat protein
MLYRQFSNEINLEKKPICTFKNHKNSVQTAEFLSSNTIISGDHDGFLKEWDIEKNTELNSWRLFNNKAIWAISTPSSKSPVDAAIGSAYNQIAFLDKRKSKG